MTANGVVEVTAGAHDRVHCPVSVALPAESGGERSLIDEATGRRIALQRLSESQFAFLLPELRAGSRAIYRLEAQPDEGEPDEEARSGAGRLEVRHEQEALALFEDDRYLARYVYAGVPARPYFYPILAPGGVPVTRSYPMRDDVPGERHDHPHHRSMWIAYGDVNGADNWSEEPGHGYTEHGSIDEIQSGRVFAGFRTTSLWLDSDRRPLLTQLLDVRVWRSCELFRLFDVVVILSATHGDVRFGDTKEGGILSVRVASSMDVPRGGRIENSYGGIDEAETWGLAAHWCDYSGQVDGAKVGIAVLDHPWSFRYPSHWHVRNYGLMTANPFGYSHYTDGRKQGDHLLEAGHDLEFRYRVAVHRGNASEAGLRGRYLDFVSPPRATLTQPQQD
jgi:hypothetical protein